MIEGKNVIGSNLSSKGNKKFKAVEAATGKFLDGDFYMATDEEVEEAVQLAVNAFEEYSRKTGKERYNFLYQIADEIEDIGEELTQRAMKESGLPEARIKGETGRTTGQLRLFAKLVAEGSWVDASIDTAIPDRKPLAKPDIRKMLRPIGPVAVFTASNFPLAFSTAGGDTASALAAGNPVIVKAHESHPGTNELIAKAIQNAIRKCGMPEGVFSSLNGDGFKTGEMLVKHKNIKSVAFTGSYSGGRALYNMAMEREEPIPVFAEMGSVNPVILLPDYLENNVEKAAADMSGSITLGAGQFCTNPGLILTLKGASVDNFKSSLAEKISEINGSPMLNERISDSFHSGRKGISDESGVQILVDNNETNQKAAGVVASVSGEEFIKNPKLHEELFGPFSLVVECENKGELNRVLEHMKGQLTGSVMCTEKDCEDFEDTIQKTSSFVGRLIFNGVPTGVEVCYSMHHGGPFPATTDSRFTSVGTDAIKRFARPVCFQDAPNNFLPDELKVDNPLNIWRKVNGELTR